MTHRTQPTLLERFETGASLLPPLALLWVAARKHWIPVPPVWCVVAMGIALFTGMLMPAAFAGWHRGVRRVQSWLGRHLLALLLSLVFLVVVIPVGILLRLLGKSFLDHGSGTGGSHWIPARPPGSLRDQF